MRWGWAGLLILAMGAPAGALAQTIQLPSIHEFSVDTTVVVPDSGHAWVAGDKRGASGSNRFGGIPPQRAAGVERRAGGVGVTAQIHDPEQADQALLRQARERRAAVDGPGPAAPQGTAGPVLKPNDPGLQSVAEIRRQRAQHAAAQDREAAALVEKARQARSEGKTSTAALYYRMALRQARGASKATIEAELRGLNAPVARPARTARAAK